MAFQSSSSLSVSTCGEAVSFGFKANYIKITNDGASTVAMQIGSTTATSSGSYLLKINESIPIDMVRGGGYENIGFRTAATSGAAATVRILALKT